MASRIVSGPFVPMFKRERVRSKRHLRWLHELPCIVTGTSPVEAAHISYADPCYGKEGRGTGLKEDDCWCVPLAPAQHRKQHGMNERTYWKQCGIDPCAVARDLWECSGNTEKALAIIAALAV